MTELEYILSRTKTAYSRLRYGAKEWKKCAEFLLEKYGQDAAIGILCSKEMRWAADWNEGKPTVEGLKAYLEEDPLTEHDLNEFKEYEKKTR